MNQKRLPITQDPLKVTNKIIFAYGLWHREHQRDVRRNQINLRVVFLSKLMDVRTLNTGIMNQSINHSDEHLNATAAQRLALAAVGGRVDSPSKRESAEARKMLKKRGAYPKSGARCVGRP